MTQKVYIFFTIWFSFFKAALLMIKISCWANFLRMHVKLAWFSITGRILFLQRYMMAQKKGIVSYKYWNCENLGSMLLRTETQKLWIIFQYPYMIRKLAYYFFLCIRIIQIRLGEMLLGIEKSGVIWSPRYSKG